MASRQSRQPPADTAIARMLAVAALIVGAIVFLIVVAGSGGDDGGSEERPRPTATTSEPKSGEEYYVIEPDDTFLGIAEEVGLSQAELERLNPNLDTQILPVQGCVNLVPDGCKALADN